jgi:2-iminobutanoate/2-iminopropanoate deaminase
MVAGLAGLVLAACTPTRLVVVSEAAPAAIGPYSQAIVAGPLVYVSGQIGLDPVTGQMVEGGIEAQTERALQSAAAILTKAGASLQSVVQAQVFLHNLDDYATVNRIWSRFFPQAPPARAAVQVARLPKDALIEVMLTAIKKP